MIPLEMISTVGFPIAITFYLLFRFEKKLEENTKVINKLIEVLPYGRRRK